MTTRLLPAGAAMLLASAAVGHPPSDRSVDRGPRRRAAFDASTGRDLLNYPPHRSADILHQRIELEAPDMNTPRMSGVTTIRVAPIAGDAESIVLHAAELFIVDVGCEGRTARFSVAPGSDRLEISLSPPLPLGQVAEIRIEYELNDPAEGITWTPESPHWPGRPASFHSQGQPEGNRFWFPTFDFPSERLTSEVVITLPEGYQAVSNGQLVERASTAFASTGKPAVRYHFAQEQEHAPYLIALAAGKWDVVDVAPSGSSVPMPVYVPIGQGPRVKPVFGRTPAMVALFERLFAEPYPWIKYAQVCVTNFSWGGMENTSATTLYDNAALDQTALLDGDLEELIAHELAHQWFGDLLTCRSWEHIWLNEGWATFAEALWEQYKGSSLGSRRDGSPTSGLRADHDAYQLAIWRNFRSVIDEDRADAPFQPAMASKEYAEPEEVFNRAANPYPKGAAVLHMLRTRLTEPVFWKGVELYVDRHRNQPVETFQFRMCMEEVSGLSLQRFFDQWCYRPGTPRLRVTPRWDSESRALTITAEQLQNIDGANPAFAFDLPVWIADGASPPQTLVLPIDARTTSASFPLGREPRRIVVDPELTVLAEIEVVQSDAALAETLRAGPTLAAKLRAAHQLAATPGERSASALGAAARDGRASRGLRIEALEGLGHLAQPESGASDSADSESPGATTDPAASAAAVRELLVLAGMEVSDARVRAALAEQLGLAATAPVATRETRKAVTEILMERWHKDRSNAVRAESLRSLGRMKAVDAMDALAAGLRTDSHDDVIREGAVEAIGLAGFPDALDLVLPMTLPSNPPGVRQEAIKAAARVSNLDRERVFNVLSALINDPEFRTRRAAVSELLKLDDPRARPTVDQWVSGARGTADRLWGQALLDRTAPD